MWRYLAITAAILGTMLPTVASAAPEARWRHHAHGPVVVVSGPLLPPPPTFVVPVAVPLPAFVQYVPVPVAVPVAVAP